MSAALRLADILELREKREQLAAQSALRGTEQNQAPASEQDKNDTANTDDTGDNHRGVWDSILGTGKNNEL